MTPSTRKVVPVAAPGPLAPVEDIAILAEAFSVSPAWSRSQLQFWFGRDSAATLARRLTRLTQRGIVERRRIAASSGSGQYVYFLSRLGTTVVFGSAVARRKGRPGWDVYHSLGLTEFFLTLDAALRALDGELITWWGQAAASCPIESSSGSYVNPDAAFLIGHAWEQYFLLEYDRAPRAAGLIQFTNKLLRYLRYYDRRAYRGHLNHENIAPLLLCLFEDEARMQRIRQRCSQILARTHGQVPTMLFGGIDAARLPLSPAWYLPDVNEPVSLLDERLR
jgi:hypothetical protein